MRRLGAGVAVLCAYAALVVWLTWPLADLAATNFPLTVATSSTDVPLATWAAAHETRTLFSGPAALADAGIYHPTSNSLYYAEAGFGALPIFAPVFLATGNPTLAMNVVFLAGVALTAAAIHAVTRRWSGSHLGGIVAGATFVTTPWVLWTWMSTAPNYAVVFYLPFIMLLAATPRATWGATVGLGVLIGVQGLTSPYVAFATCAPLAVLACHRALRPETRVAGLHLAASLVIASALSAPAYWGYLGVQRENPNLAAQSIYAGVQFMRTVLPDDLGASMSPTGLPAVVWAMVVAGGLCRMLLGPAAAGAPGAQGWRHAVFWALVGTYLSIKPHVVVGGVRLTLPHVLLTPVYAALRVPSRLGVTALMACSILAGLAFVELAGRLRGRRAAIGRIVSAAAFLGLLLTSYFRPIPSLMRMLDPRAPYPTAPAPVRQAVVDDVIARFDGALLELPVSLSAASHAVAMYRAIGHRRPLLNGYSGYYPIAVAARMALACRLPDPEALAALVRTTDVGMILVHVSQLDLARRSAARAPYRCPPTDDTAGAEVLAWRKASLAGARADLRLLAKGPNGDLLFRVER